MTINYVQRKKVNFDSISEILQKSIETNHFSNDGPVKKELEAELSKVLRLPSSKRIVCAANGTAALHSLFFLFSKRSKKDLIWASPSFTFPSPLVGGFDCKLYDIDLTTYTIPLNNEIIKNHDAFLITNLFGTYPSNIMEWIERCERENKILVFDNASSPLTEINGVNICEMGDASFGSLHHTKYLGFGEGGFAVVNSEDYDELNSILGFGYKGNSKMRIFNKYSSNFKMSDTSAAFILSHIKDYDIDKHVNIQSRYVDLINSLEGLEILNYNEGTIYGNLPLLFDNKMKLEHFDSSGIEVQKYYTPLVVYNNSQNIYNRIINFPLHAGLNDDDVDTICNYIENI